MVLVAGVVLASAFFFWSTLFQAITEVSVSLGRCPRHASAYGYSGSTESWISQEMSISAGAMLGSTVDTFMRQYLGTMEELHTFSTMRRTRILNCCSPFSCRFFLHSV